MESARWHLRPEPIEERMTSPPADFLFRLPCYHWEETGDGGGGEEKGKERKKERKEERNRKKRPVRDATMQMFRVILRIARVDWFPSPTSVSYPPPPHFHRIQPASHAVHTAIQSTPTDEFPALFLFFVFFFFFFFSFSLFFLIHFWHRRQVYRSNNQPPPPHHHSSPPPVIISISSYFLFQISVIF